MITESVCGLEQVPKTELRTKMICGCFRADTRPARLKIMEWEAGKEGKQKGVVRAMLSMAL